MMKKYTRRGQGTEAVLLSGLGLICATQGHAQTAPPAAADQSTPLAQVVVTGTLIPTSPDAAAVPVTTLDAEQLQAAGVTNNALDMLRKSMPAFAGRTNQGPSNAQNRNLFTAGGSQMELRNMPTLVLVDGERLAIDGVAGFNGSKDFVDVSQIPAAALQRVDVLTDGASSLYGSDAIGGVVNFILKRNYNGVSVGGTYGGAAGDYREDSAFVTAGSDFGPINITATVSYSRSMPLWQSARSFASPEYAVTSGTALPGVVGGGGYALSPSLLAPNVPSGVNATAGSYAQLATQGVYSPTSVQALANGFNYAPYAMLLQGEEHKNFAATITSKSFFDGRLKAFGDVMLSQNQVQSTAWQTQGTPFSFVSLNVPAGAPYNPLTTTAAGVTFADASLPKGVYDTTDASRVTLGLKGELWGGWLWQSSIDYSESKLNEDDTNLLYKPNVPLAVAGGYDANGNPTPGGAFSKVYPGFSSNNTSVLQAALDPFAVGGYASGSLANLFGTEILHGDSKLYSWDGHVEGAVLHLPAGAIDVAAGLNWRREQVSGAPDPNGRVTDPVTGSATGNDQNWSGGVFTDPFSHGRDDSAVYAETRVPITSGQMHVPLVRQFDLVAAARFEHYSDAGSATTPKFGFRWEPFDGQLIIRGDYTKSFVAPPLYQAYGPFDLRTAAGSIITSVLGPNYADLGATSFNAEDGANPALAPATAVSRSFGFVFRPNFVKGLTVDADFSSINLYGFAGGIGFAPILSSVNALGSASPFFNNVGAGQYPNLGGSDPFTHPGDLQAFLTDPKTGLGDPAKAAQLYVVDRFTNLAVLRERSWTVGVTYVLPWTKYGTYTFSTNGAVFNSFEFLDGVGDPAIQYAGNASNSGVFAGSLPKYRFYSTLDWEYEGFDLLLGNTYVSSVTDRGLNGTTSPGIPISSYSTWDLRGAHDWSFGADGARKLTLALGVNNLGNTMPPLAPRAFANTHTNADIGTYSPIGRLVYGSVAVSF
jgi:outer membrane receptor protein involved in Fe transport